MVAAWNGMPNLKEEIITPKELHVVPIAMTCTIWDHQWQGGITHFPCDNIAVVEVVNSGYSRHSEVQQ